MSQDKNLLDMFSGIGGFSLAAYWAGLRFTNHYFSEIDPYAISVYQRRFPDSVGAGDCKRIDYRSLPSGKWLICGGFPCQPHSLAGNREGSEDERDLWPECARALRELRPAVAVFENVPGLFTSDDGRFFNRVISDISACGYDAEWQVISAFDVGAPHLRKRVWIVCYDPDATVGGAYLGNAAGPRLDEGKPGQSREIRDESGRSKPERRSSAMADSPRFQQGREIERAERERTGESGESEFVSDAIGTGLEVRGSEREYTEQKFSAFERGYRESIISDSNSAETSRQRRDSWHGLPVTESQLISPRCGSHAGNWIVEPDVGRVAHGVPSRVDRLKSLGNSIVPQVAEVIFNLPFFDQFRPIDPDPETFLWNEGKFANAKV